MSARPHGGIVRRVFRRGAGDGCWPFSGYEEDVDGGGLGAVLLNQVVLQIERDGEAYDAGAV